MTDTESIINLFVSNSQTIKDGFWGHSTSLKRTAALLYTAHGKKFETGSIRESYDQIKQNTGVFSAWRGNTRLCVAAMLSLCENSGEALSRTLETYNMLKAEGLKASDFLTFAACLIATDPAQKAPAPAVQRTSAFIRGMKEDHPFLTGRDDYIFAAALGLSDIDVSSGVLEIEELFRELKPEFGSVRGVQALSQTLVLGGLSRADIPRVTELRDALRQNRLRLDREYTLPALGVLALLPESADAVSQSVGETFSRLRSEKGFGVFSVQSQELLIFSAALTALTYARAGDKTLTAALGTGIINLVIAQQAAMAAAMAASAAAAASGAGQ